MPDLRHHGHRPQHTEIPRPKRAEGQWALGYTEPLNKNEQSKKDDDPLHVRDRILHIYSKRGFASIDPADLRGRFRWMGLYTQRAPGFDGGKTAMLEEEELDDEYFMLRVRSDGQLLSPATVRALGTIGVDFARDTADVTDRENIQYHWIRIEDVPEIWRRLDDAGLSSTEACGDSPRPFLGSPVAGVAKDEIIDGSRALEEIYERFIGDPEFSNLPRKFKTALTGHPSHDVSPETNDIAFVGTVHPVHGPGFDLWVGGGLSTNPMLAQKMGVWIPLDDVADVWAGVTSIFRDYGYRRLRSRARLKFLVADWGVEKFREVLEKEYLGRELVTCASPPSPTGHRDHIGVHEQKDGRFYVGLAPTAGRVSGSMLVALSEVMERFGVTGARLTPYQKIVLIGVDGDRVPALLDALDGIGLSGRPSQWRRNTMACTGIEFCKLAIVDTKNRARDLVAELERRFPDLDVPITVNVNGCPNACARTQVADIGLKGQLVMDGGEQVEGFQVHLGGATGLQANFGRKLRAHKVTSRGLDDYVTAVVSNFLADREAARASRRGWLAPTRSCCAARRSWRSHEQPRSPLPLPLLRGDRPLAARAGRGRRPRRLGVPRLPARVPAEDARARAAHGRSVMTAATTRLASDSRGATTAGRSPEELRDLVSHWGAELELAPAESIIEWAAATFGDRFCLTSSMADGVLAHLASRVVPGIDVLFLDTGYHFAETLGTRDAVAATQDVNLLTITPKQSVAEQDAAHGKDLFRTDPDRCCALRKVQPLAERLADYDAWATGLRRAETRNRVIAPVVGWDAKKGKVKVSPLARWTDEQVEQYVAEHGVLVNPLAYDGYPSIGCAPCTRRVAPGDDPRSGRWAGTAKTECGIHT